MAGLGVLAGVLMAVLASWGVGLIHGVPDQQEAINAVYVLALAMPAIVLTSGFRGILEAKHAFGIGSLIHYPIPPHLQQAYATAGFVKGQIPLAEQIAKQCLSLPIGPHLDEAGVSAVIAALKAAE